MNTIYIKVAVNYVKARIDELRTYMMMNVPVPEDKAPSITPAELNPRIQREIKLNALLSNSQNSSRATSSKCRGQNSGGEGGENQSDTTNANKSRAAGPRRPATATTTADRSKLGMIKPDPSKPPLTARLIFGGTRCKNRYCLDFMTIGMTCTNDKDSCPNGLHVPLTKMEEEDRTKILDNLKKTKAAYLNPSFKENPRVMSIIGSGYDELFPSTAPAPATSSSNGASA
jgi:hypothetical protein